MKLKPSDGFFTIVMFVITPRLTYDGQTSYNPMSLRTGSMLWPAIQCFADLRSTSRGDSADIIQVQEEVMARNRIWRIHCPSGR